MNDANDLKSIAGKFFAAYDAHDVEGMLALCSDDAKGRYAPYGRDSVVPIRGSLEEIWRAFPQAVPGFRVEVVETLLAEGNAVVAQAIMSGPMPAEVPGIAKKGEVVFIPHAYILRFDAHGKISRLDCYWDNTAINSVKASAL
jgi:ketosteroid isomerase-like protein